MKNIWQMSGNSDYYRLTDKVLTIRNASWKLLSFQGTSKRIIFLSEAYRLLSLVASNSTLKDEFNVTMMSASF